MSDKPTIEELADGMALWEESRPQTIEDWQAVARRFSEGETEARTALREAEQERDKALRERDESNFWRDRCREVAAELREWAYRHDRGALQRGRLLRYADRLDGGSPDA